MPAGRRQDRPPAVAESWGGRAAAPSRSLAEGTRSIPRSSSRSIIAAQDPVSICPSLGHRMISHKCMILSRSAIYFDMRNIKTSKHTILLDIDTRFEL
jgi:hypothetical protein